MVEDHHVHRQAVPRRGLWRSPHPVKPDAIFGSHVYQLSPLMALPSFSAVAA